MNNGWKRRLAFALAVAIVTVVAGCGGGGGGGGGGNGPNPPTTFYGGLAYAIGQGCSFGVAVLATRYSTASSAESAARQRCISEAATLAASGTLPPTCTSGWFDRCSAAAVGQNAAGRCNLQGHHGSSVSAASSTALQACRNELGTACQTLVSGCADGGAPSPGVWRPRAPPPRPIETPLRDVSVTIPSSCASQVEVCVRDYSCVDGDRVSVSVNNSFIFPNEKLLGSWSCRSVPVRQGSNSFRLVALNGTGGEGNCPNDVNTGEIRIRGGSSSDSQQWSHAGGTGSSATLNVFAGRPGGSCTPGGTVGLLYGAVATSLTNNCRSRYWGIVANHQSAASARSAAVDTCRRKGGSNCSIRATFGSAYSGNNECGALSYGESSASCGLYGGSGGTLSSAEADALSRCRSDGLSCRLAQADGGRRLALCTQ